MRKIQIAWWKNGKIWAKNQGFGWQQGCGGGGGGVALAKAPKEKWGGMGKNRGKWGEMGFGVRFFVIYVEKLGKHGVKPPPPPKKNHFCLTSWGLGVANGHHKGRNKGGEMGKKGEKSHFLQICPNFLHFYPSLHISPPFPPISPRFPPFFFALGTLWVRLWVHYPPLEPGPSEPCPPPPPNGPIIRF